MVGNPLARVALRFAYGVTRCCSASVFWAYASASASVTAS